VFTLRSREGARTRAWTTRPTRAMMGWTTAKMRPVSAAIMAAKMMKFGTAVPPMKCGRMMAFSPQLGQT
jgi:hypothetical protein